MIPLLAANIVRRREQGEPTTLSSRDEVYIYHCEPQSTSPQQDQTSQHPDNNVIKDVQPALPTAHSTQDFKVELPALTSTVQSAQQPTVTDAASNPTSPQTQPSPAHSLSPPPYSPTISPFSISNVNPAFPFPGKPTVRRKAPPPPKRFVPAKALYDFEPENNDEELAFKEGDEIEIIERNAVLEEDGWCRARVKGSKKLGLVPLEYLEIDEKASNTNNPTGTAEITAHAAASQPTSAIPHSHLNATNAGCAADGASIAGLMTAEASKPSQFSGISASSDQTSNSIGPQTGTTITTSVQNMDKVGKGMEVAGLALATVGTAAAVIPYVQGSDTQDPTDSTAIVQNECVAIAPSTPNTDLSAFSSTPFDDQLSLNNSVVGFAAIDPYFVAQDSALASAPNFSFTLAETGVPQEIPTETDPEYAAPTTVSPFAAQILPVVSSPGVGPLATPTESQDQVEDESPPVTAMTQQSPESAVDNVDWTSGEAENQADYTA